MRCIYFTMCTSLYIIIAHHALVYNINYHIHTYTVHMSYQYTSYIHPTYIPTG